MYLVLALYVRSSSATSAHVFRYKHTCIPLYGHGKRGTNSVERRTDNADRLWNQVPLRSFDFMVKMPGRTEVTSARTRCILLSAFSVLLSSFIFHLSALNFPLSASLYFCKTFFQNTKIWHRRCVVSSIKLNTKKYEKTC